MFWYLLFAKYGGPQLSRQKQIGTLIYDTTVDGYGWTGLGDLSRDTALTVTELLRCVVGGFRVVVTTVSPKHYFLAFPSLLPPRTLTKLLSNNFEP